MPEPTPYEVYAIRYATVARKSAENFIGGDAHEAGARMDYFVWLARNAERTFVIDTGFNEAAAGKRKREFLRSPAEGLRLLGIDAATVENVIVTHLHYDHIGNFDLFPRARFHLQDRELAYATGRYMSMEFFSYAYELEEVLAMVRNVYAGRVEFHDGDAEIAPGVSVHHIGGHTQVFRLCGCGRVSAGSCSRRMGATTTPTWARVARSPLSPVSRRWWTGGAGCARLPAMCDTLCRVTIRW